MTINDSDSEQLETFTEGAINFLKTKRANMYYAESSRINNIQLLDGSVIPTTEEQVFILDNEFEVFVVSTLIKYIEILVDNINNLMFGLGERTLYEYVTGWLFLAVSGHVDTKDVKRIKALLFAGFYKHIGLNDGDFEKYMYSRAQYLSEKDIDKLGKLTYTELNDYIWRVLHGIVGHYKIVRKGTIDRLGGKILYGHQSMRIHANPNAIIELTSPIDKSVRHRLVIAFNLRQAIEYYRGERHADSLMYRFDKFWRDNKIQE